MAISFSGMSSSSGVDTSAWIEALVQMKQASLKTYEEKKETLVLTTSVLENVKSFFSSFKNVLSTVTNSNLGIASFDLFAQNIVESSNIEAVSAQVTTEAKEANYEVNVNQVATETEAASTYYTEITTTTESIASFNSLLSSIGIGSGQVGITVGGAERVITLQNNDTIATLIEKLEKIGVYADYDPMHGYFSINADIDDINDDIDGDGINNTGIKEALFLTNVNSGYASDLLELFSSLTNVVTATENCKMSVFGVTDGEYIITDQEGNFTVHNIDINKTFREFFDEIAQFGLEASFTEDGAITINASGGYLISGALAEDLGLVTEDNSYTTTTKASSTVGAFSTETLDADYTSTLGEIGAMLSNSDTLKIMDQSNNLIAEITSLTMDSTVDDLFGILTDYGINGNLENSVITFTSDYGNIIGGAIAENLGVDTFHASTTTIKSGNSTTSTTLVSYVASATDWVSDCLWDVWDSYNASDKVITVSHTNRYGTDGVYTYTVVAKNSIASDGSVLRGTQFQDIARWYTEQVDTTATFVFNDNGQIYIDSNDCFYFEGTIAEYLGLSTYATKYTWTEGVTTTSSSDTISFRVRKTDHIADTLWDNGWLSYSAADKVISAYSLTVDHTTANNSVNNPDGAEGNYVENNSTYQCTVQTLVKTFTVIESQTSIREDGTTTTIVQGTTYEDLAYWFTHEVDTTATFLINNDGTITIDSNDTFHLEGRIITDLGLGISTVHQSWTTGTASTESTASVTYAAKMTDFISDTFTSSEWANVNKTISVYETYIDHDHSDNVSQRTIQTKLTDIVITTDTTFNSLAADLANYGIHLTIDDGVIKLDSDTTNFVVEECFYAEPVNQVSAPSGTTSMLEHFGITYDTVNMNWTVGTASTQSTDIVQYDCKMTDYIRDTFSFDEWESLSGYTDSSGVPHNGMEIAVMRSYIDHEHQCTIIENTTNIIITEDTKFEDLAYTLKHLNSDDRYCIDLDIENGIVTLDSNCCWIEGSIADHFGIRVDSIAQTWTAGTASTESTGIVQYDSKMTDYIKDTFTQDEWDRISKEIIVKHTEVDHAGHGTVITDVTTITITDDTTFTQFASTLLALGNTDPRNRILFSIENGIVRLDSDCNYLVGDIVDHWGVRFDSVAQSWTTGLATTESTGTITYAVKMTDYISDTFTAEDWSTIDRTIEIHHSYLDHGNGSIGSQHSVDTVIQTLTLTDQMTFEYLASVLADYTDDINPNDKILLDIDDGVITIDSNCYYITGAIPSEYGITVDTQTMYWTHGLATTQSSETVSYKITETDYISDSFAPSVWNNIAGFTDSAGNVHADGHEIAIMSVSLDHSQHKTVITNTTNITVDTNMTYGELASQLSTYGITMTITNGVISLDSDRDAEHGNGLFYIEGTIINQPYYGGNNMGISYLTSDEQSWTTGTEATSSNAGVINQAISIPDHEDEGGHSDYIRDMFSTGDWNGLASYTDSSGATHTGHQIAVLTEQLDHDTHNTVITVATVIDVTENMDLNDLAETLSAYGIEFSIGANGAVTIKSNDLYWIEGTIPSSWGVSTTSTVMQWTTGTEETVGSPLSHDIHMEDRISDCFAASVWNAKDHEIYIYQDHLIHGSLENSGDQYVTATPSGCTIITVGTDWTFQTLADTLDDYGLTLNIDSNSAVTISTNQQYYITGTLCNDFGITTTTVEQTWTHSCETTEGSTVSYTADSNNFVSSTYLNWDSGLTDSWMDADHVLTIKHNYVDHTTHAVTVEDVGTITVGNAMTFGELGTALGAYGISFSISDGVITIDSDCNYVVGDIATKLGISSTPIVQTWTFGTTPTSGTVTLPPDVSIGDPNDTFYEWWPSFVGKTIEIKDDTYDFDSKSVVTNTIDSTVITATTTLDEVSEWLSNHGITLSITNGTATISSSTRAGRYITGDGAEALGATTHTVAMVHTYGTVTTDAFDQYGVNGNTTLHETLYNDWDGLDKEITVTEEYVSFDTTTESYSIQTVVSSMTVTDSTTFQQLSDFFGSHNVSMTIANGVVSVNGTNNSYVGGDIITELNLGGTSSSTPSFLIGESDLTSGTLLTSGYSNSDYCRDIVGWDELSDKNFYVLEQYYDYSTGNVATRTVETYDTTAMTIGEVYGKMHGQYYYNGTAYVGDPGNGMFYTFDGEVADLLISSAGTSTRNVVVANETTIIGDVLTATADEYSLMKDFGFTNSDYVTIYKYDAATGNSTNVATVNVRNALFSNDSFKTFMDRVKLNSSRNISCTFSDGQFSFTCSNGYYIGDASAHFGFNTGHGTETVSLGAYSETSGGNIIQHTWYDTVTIEGTTTIVEPTYNTWNDDAITNIQENSPLLDGNATFDTTISFDVFRKNGEFYGHIWHAAGTRITDILGFLDTYYDYNIIDDNGNYNIQYGYLAIGHSDSFYITNMSESARQLFNWGNPYSIQVGTTTSTVSTTTTEVRSYDEDIDGNIWDNVAVRDLHYSDGTSIGTQHVRLGHWVDDGNGGLDMDCFYITLSDTQTLAQWADILDGYGYDLDFNFDSGLYLSGGNNSESYVLDEHNISLFGSANHYAQNYEVFQTTTDNSNYFTKVADENSTIKAVTGGFVNAPTISVRKVKADYTLDTAEYFTLSNSKTIGEVLDWLNSKDGISASFSDGSFYINQTAGVGNYVITSMDYDLGLPESGSNYYTTESVTISGSDYTYNNVSTYANANNSNCTASQFGGSKSVTIALHTDGINPSNVTTTVITWGTSESLGDFINELNNVNGITASWDAENHAIDISGSAYAYIQSSDINFGTTTSSGSASFKNSSASATPMVTVSGISTASDLGVTNAEITAYYIIDDQYTRDFTTENGTAITGTYGSKTYTWEANQTLAQFISVVNNSTEAQTYGFKLEQDDNGNLTQTGTNKSYFSPINLGGASMNTYSTKGYTIITEAAGGITSIPNLNSTNRPDDVGGTTTFTITHHNNSTYVQDNTKASDCISTETVTWEAGESLNDFIDKLAEKNITATIDDATGIFTFTGTEYDYVSDITGALAGGFTLNNPTYTYTLQQEATQTGTITAYMDLTTQPAQPDLSLTDNTITIVHHLNSDFVDTNWAGVTGLTSTVTVSWTGSLEKFKNDLAAEGITLDYHANGRYVTIHGDENNYIHDISENLASTLGLSNWNSTYTYNLRQNNIDTPISIIEPPSERTLMKYYGDDKELYVDIVTHTNDTYVVDCTKAENCTTTTRITWNGESSIADIISDLGDNGITASFNAETKQFSFHGDENVYVGLMSDDLKDILQVQTKEGEGTSFGTHYDYTLTWSNTADDVAEYTYLNERNTKLINLGINSAQSVSIVIHKDNTFAQDNTKATNCVETVAVTWELGETLSAFESKLADYNITSSVNRETGTWTFYGDEYHYVNTIQQELADAMHIQTKEGSSYGTSYQYYVNYRASADENAEYCYLNARNTKLSNFDQPSVSGSQSVRIVHHLNQTYAQDNTDATSVGYTVNVVETIVVTWEEGETLQTFNNKLAAYDITCAVNNETKQWSFYGTEDYYVDYVQQGLAEAMKINGGKTLEDGYYHTYGNSYEYTISKRANADGTPETTFLNERNTMLHNMSIENTQTIGIVIHTNNTYAQNNTDPIIYDDDDVRISGTGNSISKIDNVTKTIYVDWTNTMTLQDFEDEINSRLQTEYESLGEPNNVYSNYHIDFEVNANTGQWKFIGNECTYVESITPELESFLKLTDDRKDGTTYGTHYDYTINYRADADDEVDLTYLNKRNTKLHNMTLTVPQTMTLVVHNNNTFAQNNTDPIIYDGTTRVSGTGDSKSKIDNLTQTITVTWDTSMTLQQFEDAVNASLAAAYTDVGLDNAIPEGSYIIDFKVNENTGQWKFTGNEYTYVQGISEGLENFMLLSHEGKDGSTYGTHYDYTINYRADADDKVDHTYLNERNSMLHNFTIEEEQTMVFVVHANNTYAQDYTDTVDVITPIQTITENGTTSILYNTVATDVTRASDTTRILTVTFTTTDTLGSFEAKVNSELADLYDEVGAPNNAEGSYHIDFSVDKNTGQWTFTGNEFTYVQSISQELENFMLLSHEGKDGNTYGTHYNYNINYRSDADNKKDYTYLNERNTTLDNLSITQSQTMDIVFHINNTYAQDTTKTAFEQQSRSNGAYSDVTHTITVTWTYSPLNTEIDMNNDNPLKPETMGEFLEDINASLAAETTRYKNMFGLKEDFNITAYVDGDGKLHFTGDEYTYVSKIDAPLAQALKVDSVTHKYYVNENNEHVNLTQQEYEALGRPATVNGHQVIDTGTYGDAYEYDLEYVNNSDNVTQYTYTNYDNLKLQNFDLKQSQYITIVTNNNTTFSADTTKNHTVFQDNTSSTYVIEWTIGTTGHTKNDNGTYNNNDNGIRDGESLGEFIYELEHFGSMHNLSTEASAVLGNEIYGIHVTINDDKTISLVGNEYTYILGMSDDLKDIFRIDHYHTEDQVLTAQNGTMLTESTKLSTIGLSSGNFTMNDGAVVNIGANDSIVSKLRSTGLSVSVSNGRIYIDGNSSTYIKEVSRDLADALNFKIGEGYYYATYDYDLHFTGSDKNAQYNSDYTIYNHDIEFTDDNYTDQVNTTLLNYDTRLNNLSIMANMTMTLETPDGGKSIEIDADTTIQELKERLFNDYGIDVTVGDKDGLLTFTPTRANEGYYILGIDTEFKNKFHIITGENGTYSINSEYVVPTNRAGVYTTAYHDVTAEHGTYGTSTIDNYDNTASRNLEYKDEHVTAKLNTRISRLNGYESGNGKIMVHYADGLEQDINIRASMTIAQLCEVLGDYGIKADILAGGRVTFSSDDGTYLKSVEGGSNLLEVLNMSDFSITTEGDTIITSKTLLNTVVNTSTYFATEDTFLCQYDNGLLEANGVITFTLNDKYKSVTITSDDTFGSLISKFKEKGLNAKIEAGVFSVSSGFDTFSIVEGATTSNLSAIIKFTEKQDLGGYAMTDRSKTIISTTTSTLTNAISIANYADESTTFDTFNIIGGTLSVFKDGQKASITIRESSTIQSLQNEIRRKFGQDINGSKEDNINVEYENGYLKIYQEGANIIVGSNDDTSNFSAITGIMSDSSGVANSTRQFYKVNEKSKVTEAGIFRNGNVTTGSFIIGNAKITIDENSTIGDIIAQINTNSESNVNAYWDSIRGEFVLKSKTTGDFYINIEAIDTNFTDILGLTSSTFNENNVATSSTINTDVQKNGKNARVTINGASYTSVSNTMGSDITGIKGLTINVKNLTLDSPAILTVKKDVESLALAVSDVIDGYNALIENINSALNSNNTELRNDSELKRLRNRIKSIMTGTNKNSSMFKNAVAIGIVTDAADPTNLSVGNGIYKLALDYERFAKAFESDATSLRTLLIGRVDEFGNILEEGILTQIEAIIDDALDGASGYFDRTEESFEKRIDKLETKIVKGNAAIEKYREKLEKKYMSMNILNSNMQTQYQVYFS